MNRVSLFACAAALMVAWPAVISAQEKTMTTSTGMELVWIPPGEFMLGSTPEEREWAVANGAPGKNAKAEGDQPRRTLIKQGFWMGRTSVTIGQWKMFVNATGYVTDGEKKGTSFAPQGLGKAWTWAKGASWRNLDFGFALKDNHPVTCLSWNDATAFCEWLTETEKKAGKLPVGMICRLPAEAEREYACRAGRQTKFWWGDSKEGSERRLNWNGADDGFESLSPVDHYGSRGRNGFGLADMLGGVREWCLDGWDENGAHGELWAGSQPVHMVRGGGFLANPGSARCACRSALGAANSSASDGLRVCCGVPGGSGQPVGYTTEPLAATSPTPTPAAPPSPKPALPPPAAATPAAGSTLTTSTGMEMIWIPAGEFMLGSTPEEREWANANGGNPKWTKLEGDQPRRVEIKPGFWMGRTELTIGQWKNFVNSTGYVTDAEKLDKSQTQRPGERNETSKGANWKLPMSDFNPKDNDPVCCISRNDAMQFCVWLTSTEKKAQRLPDGMACRLPTEAEWEYACRGGTQTRFWWGDTIEGGEGRLHWEGSKDGFEFVTPVDHFGQRGRNKFGLADMLGNVREWCLDGLDNVQAHAECYSGGEPWNGVTRGGAYHSKPATLRCAFDQCRFEKRGGWYAYYSTKWGCDSCLFYKCSFASLKGKDYGINLQHCAFVSMNFPELEHERPKDEDKKVFDHMKCLRSKWNTIKYCQFVDCDVAPTVGWSAVDSNFMGCRFPSGEAFESKKSLDVVDYVADTVGLLPHKIWRAYPAPLAPLKVSYAETPFETVSFPALSRPLGPLLPKLSADAKLCAWLSSKTVASGSGVAKETFAVAETPASGSAATTDRRETTTKTKEEEARPRRVAGLADAGMQQDARKFARMQSSIKGLYVIHTEAGLRVGGAQDIIATAERASSKRETICDFTGEVARDTQISMEEAERLLKVRYPVWQAGYKIRFSYGNKYAKQAGGSAGGAFSVLLLSLLDGMQIDPTFAMTGDVTVDGKIREIGAAAEKIRGAMLEKCSVVAIPVANKESLNDLAILYSPAMFWSIQIFSVGTLDNVAAVARLDRDKYLSNALTQFYQIQRALGPNAPVAYLRNRDTYLALQQVLQLAPNHLSAEFMLRAANNQLPNALSLGGSLDEIWAAAGPLLGFLFADYKEPDKSKRYYMERVPSEAFKTAMERLNWLQMRLHPKTRDLRGAMADYMASLDQLHRATTFSSVMLKTHLEKRDRVLGEALRLGVDRKVLEEMMH